METHKCEIFQKVRNWRNWILSIPWVSVYRETKSPWFRQYKSYISNWYVNGKVFTSTTTWEPRNLIFFFQKSSKLNLTCTYMSTSGMHRRPFEGRHLVVQVLVILSFLISVLLVSYSSLELLLYIYIEFSDDFTCMLLIILFIIFAVNLFIYIYIIFFFCVLPFSSTDWLQAHSLCSPSCQCCWWRTGTSSRTPSSPSATPPSSASWGSPAPPTPSTKSLGMLMSRTSTSPMWVNEGIIYRLLVSCDKQL